VCVCADVHPEPAKCVGHRALGMTGRSLLNILTDTAAIVREYRVRPAPHHGSLLSPGIGGGLGAPSFLPGASSAAAVLAGTPARRPDAVVPFPDVPGDAAATAAYAAQSTSPVPPPPPEAVGEEGTGAAGVAPTVDKIECAALMKEVHLRKC